MFLPNSISDLIDNESFDLDQVGKSNSSVMIFPDKVLKIQAHDKESEQEYEMMKWLHPLLPVPKVYAYEIYDDKSYLLMSKCAGEMACSEYYMQNEGSQIELVARGLEKLWSIDIANCPCDSRLNIRLEQARYNVENDLVNVDDVELETFGANGFKDTFALLQWLYDHQPEEELVLSHGDYCLPNLFGQQENVSGYIDLGKTGIADRWSDLALCYRDLAHKHKRPYHFRDDATKEDMRLFKRLGIEPNWEKIHYYILLDELF